MEGMPTSGPDPRDTPERPPAHDAPPSSPGGGLAESRTWLGDQGLARPRQGRMIAGVCAGLSRRYGMPVFLVRVLMVAVGLAGFGVLFYIVLWVLMPKDG